MKLLLDTHVWLWRLLEPERITDQAEELIADPAAELFLSPISVWEALVLARKGRLSLARPPTEWVLDALRRSAPTAAPLTNGVAIRSENLDEFTSSDPADHFLVATAIEQDLSLVTADEAMRRYQTVRTVW